MYRNGVQPMQSRWVEAEGATLFTESVGDASHPPVSLLMGAGANGGRAGLQRGWWTLARRLPFSPQCVRPVRWKFDEYLARTFEAAEHA